MRIILFTGILGFLLLVISCRKLDPIPTYPFKAEVIGLNQDCRLFAIKVLEGVSEIQNITDSHWSDSVYIAKNLPATLQIEGLVIVFDARDVRVGEVSWCTNVGPSYPWLYVKHAVISE